MQDPSDQPPRERPSEASPAQGREDRLKAALKANMARRKAQAKARTARQGGNDTGDNERSG